MKLTTCLLLTSLLATTIFPWEQKFSWNEKTGLKENIYYKEKIEELEGAFFYDETLGTVFLISKKPIFKEKTTDLTLDNKTVKFWRVNDYVSELEPEDLNSFLKVTTEKQTLASISNIKFKIKKLKGE